MCSNTLDFQNNVRGLQHIGLPVRNIDSTLDFYGKLGFSILWESTINGNRVCFLRGLGITVEAYENPVTTGKAGAIDHISLDVYNLDMAWDYILGLGLIPAGENQHDLPFFAQGVRFFTIEGPDGEKIEFNQIV